MGINSAPRAATRELRIYVDQVLKALEQSGALVTDRSLVSDFLEWGDAPGKDERNREVLNDASLTLGVPVERGDLIVAVAKRRKEYVSGGRS